MCVRNEPTSNPSIILQRVGYINKTINNFKRRTKRQNKLVQNAEHILSQEADASPTVDQGGEAGDGGAAQAHQGPQRAGTA